MVHVHCISKMILCHIQLFALPDNSPLYHCECCTQATLSQAFQSVLILIEGKINVIIVGSILVVMVKISVIIEDTYKYQVVEFTPTPPDLKWRLFGSVR